MTTNASHQSKNKVIHISFREWEDKKHCEKCFNYHASLVINQKKKILMSPKQREFVLHNRDLLKEATCLQLASERWCFFSSFFPPSHYAFRTTHAQRRNKPQRTLPFLAAFTICWASCSAASNCWIPPWRLLGSIF